MWAGGHESPIVMASTMRRRTILVVDDEPHITHVVALKLERAGYEVFTASDGEEALALVASKRPDLVVTDFQMPILSGYDMCVRLAEMPGIGATPVLMITARGHMLTEDDLARTNIQAVMCKPFSPREVLETIERILGIGEIKAA